MGKKDRGSETIYSTKRVEIVGAEKAELATRLKRKIDGPVFAETIEPPARLTADQKQRITTATGLHFEAADWTAIEAAIRKCTWASRGAGAGNPAVAGKLKKIKAAAIELLNAARLDSETAVVVWDRMATRWDRMGMPEPPKFNYDVAMQSVSLIAEQAEIELDAIREQKRRGIAGQSAFEEFVFALAFLFESRKRPVTFPRAPDHGSTEVRPSLFQKFVCAVAACLPDDVRRLIGLPAVPDAAAMTRIYRARPKAQVGR